MNILVVGAHPDDFELGMGGTIIKHSLRGDKVIGIVVSNGEKIGKTEERVGEARKSADMLGIKELVFLEMEDTKISDGAETIEAIEKISEDHSIDRVYTHSMNDTHQDHRNTSFATLSACRKVPQIMFYESPSSSIDFKPVFFIDIKNQLKSKISALQSYKSLEEKRYFEIKTIESLAKFRGHQAKTEYAESFEVYRFLE